MSENSGSRIVVGVDGSPSSKNALHWARHFAALENTSIDAVIAWEYPPELVSVGGIPPVYDPQVDAEKTLEQTVDDVFGSERPADLRLIVRPGRPAHVLLQLSDGAKLLVVGSRGRGAMAGALLGSVSARVAGHAPCPVLVVPEGV